MTQQISTDLKAFEDDGFMLLPSEVGLDTIEYLAQELAAVKTSSKSAGTRNLLNLCPAVRHFASSGIAHSIVSRILGPALRPVRAILFDKTPEANWYVTWHQDLTIPVKEKFEVEGFGPWSVKDYIVHVQPPAAILERMVSLRVHLDDCNETNGAIKFLAATQKGGALNPDEIQAARSSHREVVCSAKRGDIIAMRPLIVHSSSRADTPGHRRVLHLEYAAASLPSPLEWAEA